MDVQVDDAISRVAEELSSADDHLDFTAPLAPLATVKFNAYFSFVYFFFLLLISYCFFCLLWVQGLCLNDFLAPRKTQALWRLLNPDVNPHVRYYSVLMLLLLR